MTDHFRRKALERCLKWREAIKRGSHHPEIDPAEMLKREQIHLLKLRIERSGKSATTN